MNRHLLFQKLRGIYRRMLNNPMEGSVISFENIKTELNKYQGGNVSLTKDSTTGIATLLLDRPKKYNALTGRMLVEFRDGIEILEKWKEGKAVIVTGNGKNFCSGGDLEIEKTMGVGTITNSITWIQDALKRLQKLPLISVCLVHGATFGGGAELPLFCDFIVATDNVQFGFIHGKVGVTTAWGGGANLVKKLGPSKALDLLLTGKTLTADECLQIGLVDTIVPSEAAYERTVDWLMLRLKYNSKLTQAFKKIVSAHHPNETAFELEKFSCASTWDNHIHTKAAKYQVKSHI